MSASYLFGETDSLEKADKSLTKDLDIAEELSDLKRVIAQKIPASSKIDPLSESLVDQTIRDIVSSVRTLAPDLKLMVLAYCKGLHDLNEKDVKKRAG